MRRSGALTEAQGLPPHVVSVVNAGGGAPARWSADGVTWTGQGVNMYYMRSVTYSPSLKMWVAVGSSSEIYSSPDGKTWTKRTVSGNHDFDTVRWQESQGLFLALSTGQGQVTSPDGITWSVRVSPFGSSHWFPGDHSTPLGITALGRGSTPWWWSDGGLTTPTQGVASNVTSDDFQRVLWVPELGKFVAVGFSSRTYHSTDGKNWTIAYNPGAVALSATDVAYSPALGRLLAVGYAGLFTSDDGGLTWTNRGNLAGSATDQTVVWNKQLAKFFVTGYSAAYGSSFSAIWSGDTGASQFTELNAQSSQGQQSLGTN